MALAQDQEEVENDIRTEQQRIEGIATDIKRLADETNAIRKKWVSSQVCSRPFAIIIGLLLSRHRQA